MDHRPTTCMTSEKIRSLLRIPQLFSNQTCDVCNFGHVMFAGNVMSDLKYLEVIFPRCAILPLQFVG